MRQSVKQKANISSFRERHCAKCEFRTPEHFCRYLEVCHAAYVRGFIKGYKERK